MGQASTIGLDIAKWVFQAHGADATGRVVFRKRLVRAKVLEFFAGQPPCLVALEACGGAHYWARELGKLGHTVRLMPPAYVKPFVKRQKNDVADAEAICEAAQRPGMRFVPVKDEAQQANTVVFRARDLLVRQRTQCINALRGHLAEYGHVVPQGPAHVDRLVALVEDPKSSVPESARGILQVLIRTLNALEEQLKELDGEIARRAKADPVARRLMTIPGNRPDRSDCDHRPGAGAGGLPRRAGLRRLAWADAAAEVDRRQAQAGSHLEDGRADHPAIADPGCQRGGPLGQSAWGRGGLVAGADARAQAAHAGHHRPGQQDGPHRLGPAGQGRHVQGSGRGGVSPPRPPRRRASGRRTWRNSRRDGIGTTRLQHRTSSTPP